MTRFVQSEDRRQGVLLPEYLDDYVAEDNPVRVIDVFVDELDLGALGFDGVIPEATGRPAYHPGALLKIYVYGYINQIASSRRLERETHRNVELIWLTGRLTPDFKTIADFRKDNGPAIRKTYRQFIALCRQLGLFAHAVAARRQQVQGGERPRQELHQGLNPAADGAGRGQHRALHGSAGNGGSPGRGTGAGQLCPPEGQDRRAQGADAGVQSHGS